MSETIFTRLGLPGTADINSVEAAAAQQRERLATQPEAIHILDADLAFARAWLGREGSPFTRFLHASAALLPYADQRSVAPWRDALATVLAEPDMQTAEAQAGFEQDIARHLAAGWRPGNEQLFEAAQHSFRWMKDRRRLLAMGAPGQRIDAALDESIPFGRQNYADHLETKRLCQRLRTGEVPTRAEVLSDLPFLNSLLERFPNLMHVLVGPQAIAMWREAGALVPQHEWRHSEAASTRAREAKARDPFRRLPHLLIGGTALMVVLGMAYNKWKAPVRPRAPVASAEATRPLRDPLEEKIFQARQAMAARDIPAAIQAYDQAEQLAPQQARIPAARALARFEGGDQAGTERDLQRAKALDPNEPGIALVRARIDYQAGKFDAAISGLSDAISRSSECTDCRLWRALAYESKHDLDNALTDADAAIAQDSRNYAAYAIRSRVWQAKGDPAKAVAQGAMLLEAWPKEGQTYLAAAQLYQGLNEPTLALRALETGRSAAPDAEARLAEASGRLLLQLKRPAEAQRQFEAVLKLRPDAAGARYGLALAKRQQGQNGDEDLRQAQKQDPSVAATYPK
ncbi:lipopolysaccharide assembly protein LapB [Massilia sp. TS11]|uniref:tetratricopeptide repeat protein n=1 Tax=Massilia sp. TS11 TaxID=2908003 RepID=UPI001EDB5D0D|nr:tetratricopeptide repeat protein [Massilia sp. TS11]MCG2584681.1 tetratricopeptide repeat protein [Massilia sp. TS11]